MFSKPLLKASIKQNYIVFIIILAVMMMYLPTIVKIYNPDNQKTINDMMSTLPKEVVSAFGFSGTASTLLSFIATYYYGFLILLLPMIYTVVVANRIISSLVDKGSMAYLLSTPNTRMKIARTQALYLIASITALLALVTLFGILICRAMFPGELKVSGFLLLNFGTLLLYYAITGIGFFASCSFNETKNSLAVGAGLPIAFLVLQMLSNVGDATAFFKYFTLYTLFNPEKIISGEGYTIPFLILAAVAVVMYGAAFAVLKKRDLPL